MKSWLTIGIIAALAVTYVGSAQTPPEAPAQYDVDHDGVISVLDLANLGIYFGQPAAPCLKVTRFHYATPVLSVDDAGNSVLIEGRGISEPGPLATALFEGTPVVQC